MISSVCKVFCALMLIHTLMISPLPASDEEHEARCSGSHKTAHLSQEDLLIQSGSKFINFLTLIGDGETPITEDGLLDLFTPSCIKIVNGQTICRSLVEHHEQLLGVRATLGKWSLNPLRVCPSVQTSACAVHFEWRGNNNRVDDVGSHVVMAILDVDFQGRIQTILEVFSPVLHPNTKVLAFSSAPQEK